VKKNYTTCKLTENRRRKVFTAYILGRKYRTTFHIIAKLDRNLSPRENQKLKDGIQKIIRDSLQPGAGYGPCYMRLLDVLWEKQIAGMCKYSHIYYK
jgi:hypothetical protein